MNNSDQSIPLSVLQEHPEALSMLCSGLLKKGQVAQVESMLAGVGSEVMFSNSSVYGENVYSRLLRDLIKADGIQTLSRWIEQDAQVALAAQGAAAKPNPILKEILLYSAKYKSAKTFDYVLGKNLRKSKLVMFELFVGGGSFAAKRIKQATCNEALELLKNMGSPHGRMSSADYMLQKEDLDFLFVNMFKEYKKYKSNDLMNPLWEFMDNLSRFVGGFLIAQTRVHGQEGRENAQQLLMHMVQSFEDQKIAFSAPQLACALTQSALSGSDALVEFFIKKLKRSTGYERLEDALACANQHIVQDALEKKPTSFRDIEQKEYALVTLRSEYAGVLNVGCLNYVCTLSHPAQTGKQYVQTLSANERNVRYHTFYEKKKDTGGSYQWGHKIQPLSLAYVALLGENIKVVERLGQEGLKIPTADEIKNITGLDVFLRPLSKDLILEGAKSLAEVYALQKMIGKKQIPDTKAGSRRESRL